MADWQQLQQRLPLLDKTRIDQLERDLGIDALRRLLGLFVEDGLQQGAALEQAFDDNDSEQMARCCHSLKSACGSYGALRCQFLSEKLELSCRRQDAELTASLMTAWQQALQQTLLQVREQLDSR